ncbi:hypothetical protein H2200_013263 [Cladophialophora chaetospira]|uniref:Uncharacterized protein n=1 Tax=Cladophialophora chaetospira TaxID=386627 RepID=A0AA38UEE1_9EURO|nr:hypothetical protein H2200_013263 [Cladophialophora chaetospira]
MPYFQPKVTLPAALSFRDKTILVTGASAGIGFAATKQFLIHGAKEIIAGVRSTTKAETARSQILSDPAVTKANPGGKITILKLEAEDYQSVLDFANVVKSRYDGTLDMLLLNAGTGSLKWEVVAKTGHEKTMQVNLLSPALLALELLPVLEKTAARTGVPSRLTWVGSFVQFDHSFEKRPIEKDEGVLQHVDDNRHFESMATYSNSKLLGTMFIEELARYVDSSKVIVNDVSPGMVATGFGEYPTWLRIMFGILFALKARSIDNGAKTYLHALGVAGKESHGKYLSDNQVAERAAFTQTQTGSEVREKLWDEVARECSRVDSNLQRLNSSIS